MAVSTKEKPVGWEILIPIIANQGLVLAHALWLKWQAGQIPTAADWAELIALANQTARDRAIARLIAAGIDPESEEGKRLLALVG